MGAIAVIVIVYIIRYSDIQKTGKCILRFENVYETPIIMLYLKYSTDVLPYLQLSA